MSLTSDLNAIKTVQDGVKNNKVTRFAYTANAYANNDVDGHSDYVATRDNNIPLSDLNVIEVNQTVVDKGFRARASALNRMFLNHLFGRVSYNLNKINDLFNDLLVKIVANLGVPNGLATLDANGRIPYTQLPEDAMEYQGDWNAQTNTPTLADGTGTKGDTYNVSVGGTQDLGSGDIVFFAGDRVIYNGSVWQRASGGNVLTVSEIAPDEINGNVDLSKQTDVRKILNSNFLNKLYLSLSARYWSHSGFGYASACTIDNGTYYVLKSNREIYKSTDRINWSLVFTLPQGGSSGNLGGMSNIIARNGKLVVIYKLASGEWRSFVLVNDVGYASASLFTFTSSGDYIGEIYFDGNSTIAFSHSSKGVYVSTDLGVSYTQVLNGNYFRLQYTNGLFHVSGTGGLKYSENLTDWYDTNITTNIFSGAVYANGLWVAGAQSGNKHPYWSTDGKTWTEGTGDTPRLSGSGTVIGTSRIAYVNGLWLAVTYGGDSSVTPCLALWSEDGKVWTHCTSPDDSVASGQSGVTSAINIIYAKGIYITNVRRGSTGHSSVYYSYNGKDWLAVDNSVLSYLDWIIYADNKFVGISDRRVWSSVDGIVWELMYENSSDTYNQPSNGKDRNDFLSYGNNIWLDVSQAIYAPSGEKYINGEQE